MSQKQWGHGYHTGLTAGKQDKVKSLDDIWLRVDYDEKWRLVRLNRVLGYIYCLSQQAQNPSVINNMEYLSDHEGELTVGWSMPPTKVQKTILTQAWCDVGNEPENSICHLDYQTAIDAVYLIKGLVRKEF